MSIDNLPDLKTTSELRTVNGATPQHTIAVIKRKTSATPNIFIRIIIGFNAEISRHITNRRLLVLQPFMLIFGILVYRATKFEPAAFAMVLIAILLMLGAFFNRNKQKQFWVFVLLLGFWAGFLLLPIHGKLFGSNMIYGAFYGQFSATVDAIHSNDSERARIIISNIKSLDERNSPPLRRARLLLPSDQLPDIGDIINAPMRLYRVPGPVVPGGYDSQFHAYFKGIGAYGSTTGIMTVTNKVQKNSLARNIQELREFIGMRIDFALAPPISGIARALIVGDQGQIDENIRTRLADAGLAHVLAISGLHLSLVAGGIFAAIRMGLAGFYGVGQKISVKKISAVGGIIAALIYLALSGASVSAVRASLMLILIFGAVLAGRRALTMRNVAFAALFVIITDPSSIFRPGFQLSFAAVIALVGSYEGYKSKFRNDANATIKLTRFFSGIALTSLIAGAATALFAAYHFQNVAPFGVLGNMVAIPLVAFIVLPAALMAVLFMPLGMEAIFFAPMGWGIEQILTVANYISSLGSGLISPPILGQMSLIIALFAMGWFAFFVGRLRFVGVVMAAFLIPVFGTMERPDIMIADTTQAIAIKNERSQELQSQNLASMDLVAGRANSFAINAWSETYLTKITAPDEKVPCDLTGCWFDRDKFNVALVKTRDAYTEDCSIADLVIARIAAPQYCRDTTQVIDQTDLTSGGVHWARWNGNEFIIRPAIVDIFRPWRPNYPSSR
ncbi:MAG: competence protein ComEC family protein [Devosiaceae bacterium]|nr:competence protein ComEC family protein [Devosiaceae bacterium]